VQAVSASGIAVLAFVAARGHPRRLAVREQLAVLVALAGLVLLAVSLIGTKPADHPPDAIAAIVWLGACAGGAVFLTGVHVRFPRAAALGLATGLLFAAGDISAKLVVYGGAWLLAIVTLIVFYGIGTTVLQAAFQHGDALTAAGLATLATNAVPIAAGFVLLGEALPENAKGIAQIAAFASLVISATLLTDPRARASSAGDGG
jgi:hypothetical protein